MSSVLLDGPMRWDVTGRGQELREALHSVGAVTLFVEDPRRSRAFYGEVFDLPVLFEDEDSVAFRFDNLVVNLLRVVAARELVDPAAVAEPESGARFQLTVWVDDADAVC